MVCATPYRTAPTPTMQGGGDMAQMIMARKAAVLKKGLASARQITLTNELRELGLDEAKEVSVAVFADKNEKWIVIRK